MVELSSPYVAAPVHDMLELERVAGPIPSIPVNPSPAVGRMTRPTVLLPGLWTHLEDIDPRFHFLAKDFPNGRFLQATSLCMDFTPYPHKPCRAGRRLAWILMKSLE